MQYLQGDIIQEALNDTDMLVIPANAIINGKKLVMGAGFAKRIRDMFEGADVIFGVLFVQVLSLKSNTHVSFVGFPHILPPNNTTLSSLYTPTIECRNLTSGFFDNINSVQVFWAVS